MGACKVAGGGVQAYRLEATQLDERGGSNERLGHQLRRLFEGRVRGRVREWAGEVEVEVEVEAEGGRRWRGRERLGREEEEEEGKGGRLRASASPSALMTLACFSCSALTTMNLERSASCCMTCFDSMALANSAPNLRSVMETSCSEMWNSVARAVSCSRTCFETLSRCVMSCSALYCATTDFSTSLPIDGSTRSS